MVIAERTVRRLSGVRVAAGNLWSRARRPGGAAEPSVQLFVGQAAPVRVWEGDQLDVDGHVWRVDAIEPGEGTTGRITVSQGS